MKLRSPAKINLFLRILRKRKDGYHELRTLFERIDLADELRFERTNGLDVRCAHPEVPGGPSNLVYRAADLLRRECGVRGGVRITIRKRIPVAAGLGGGSSNAATALIGLNRFWRLGLSRKRLLAYAARLGSDVPFFVLDTPFAEGLGRGEILRKVPARGVRFHHVLVKPPFGISTREAYAAFRPSFLTPPKADAKLLLHSIQKGRSEPLETLLINSLELTLNKRVTTILRIEKRTAETRRVRRAFVGQRFDGFRAVSKRNGRRARRARIAKKTRPLESFYGIDLLRKESGRG